MAIYDKTRGASGSLPEFARWAECAARSMGYPDNSFFDKYLENVRSQSVESIENNAIGRHLETLLDSQPLGFECFATDLLVKLNELATDEEKRQKSWPKNPVWVTRKITELRRPFAIKGWDILQVRREKGNCIKFERRAGSTGGNTGSKTELPPALNSDDKHLIAGGNGGKISNAINKASSHIVNFSENTSITSSLKVSSDDKKPGSKPKFLLPVTSSTSSPTPQFDVLTYLQQVPKKTPVAFEDVCEAVKELHDEGEIAIALARLKASGDVFEPAPGRFQVNA